MTKDQIDGVLNRVRSWPKARQEHAARLLLEMETQDSGPYRLSDEERADLEAALKEIANGDIASDAEVRAAFAPRFK